MDCVDNKDVVRFEKVSFEQYSKDMHNFYPRTDEFMQYDEEFLWRMWNAIKLPSRATTGSAGYDFFAPFEFELYPGEQIVIPTGIRAVFLRDGWELTCFPRSSSVKSHLQMINTIGLMDSDYFLSDNEGHIMIFLAIPHMPEVAQHHSKFGVILDRPPKKFEITAGNAFVQGKIGIYGLKYRDEDDYKIDRNGGFGSTDNGGEIEIPKDENLTDETPKPDDENKDPGTSIPIPGDEDIKEEGSENTDCPCKNQHCAFDSSKICGCEWRFPKKEETDPGTEIPLPGGDQNDPGMEIPIPDDEDLTDETPKDPDEEVNEGGEIEIPKDEDLTDETPPIRDYTDYDIEGSDCGSRLGDVVQLTPKNIDYYYMHYIITADGVERLTPKNEEKYLNKTVAFRHPNFCISAKEKRKICSVCAGIIPSDEEWEVKPPSDIEIVEGEVTPTYPETDEGTSIPIPDNEEIIDETEKETISDEIHENTYERVSVISETEVKNLLNALAEAKDPEMEEGENDSIDN